MTNRLGVRFLDPAGGNPGDTLRINDAGTAVEYGPAPSGSGGVESIVAGTNITVDDTDPANPIVSAVGGAGGGGWTLIEEHVFATAGAGYTFTVPAGYDELRLVVIGRTDEGATRGTLELVLNGDATAANYSFRRELDTAGFGAANYMGLISAANSGSPQVASFCDWRFPQYGGTTWQKVATGRWNAGSSVGVGSVTWANAAAITSLRVQARTSSGSKFLAGSIVRLYAI